MYGRELVVENETIFKRKENIARIKVMKGTSKQEIEKCKFR
jgi:hypothetical protein